MNNKQLILAGIVVLIIIAGGFYYFSTNNAGTSSPTGTTTAATSTSGTSATKATGSAGSSKNSSGSGAQPFAPSTEGVSLWVAPSSGTEPFTAKFSGTVPSSLNGSYTFSLTYGDGTAPEAVPASCVGSACTLTASHVYKISGAFTPELSAITKCASISPPSADCEHVSYVIAKTPVTVTGGGATASLVVTPSLLKAGETADILVEGSGSGLVVDFGDGASQSLAAMTNQIASVEHVYATAGTYALTVKSGTQTIVSLSVLVQ